MTGCRCPRFPTTLAPVLLLAASMALASSLPAAVPLVENVELQPLKAQALVHKFKVGPSKPLRI